MNFILLNTQIEIAVKENMVIFYESIFTSYM